MNIITVYNLEIFIWTSEMNWAIYLKTQKYNKNGGGKYYIQWPPNRTRYGITKFRIWILATKRGYLKYLEKDTILTVQFLSLMSMKNGRNSVSM